MTVDVMQQLLQNQSLIAASQSGGKRAYLFGIIPMDMETAGGLGMQSCSPFAKNVPTLFQGTGKQNSIADKILQAFASIPEDLRKRASEAGVMYSGDLPSGSLPGSAGGGFASMAGGGRGDLEMS